MLAPVKMDTLGIAKLASMKNAVKILSQPVSRIMMNLVSAKKELSGTPIYYSASLTVQKTNIRQVRKINLIRQFVSVEKAITGIRLLLPARSTVKVRKPPQVML